MKQTTCTHPAFVDHVSPHQLAAVGRCLTNTSIYPNSSPTLCIFVSFSHLFPVSFLFNWLAVRLTSQAGDFGSSQSSPDNANTAMDGDGDLKDSDPNDFPRRSSRRFTTLEGWREVRGGLYLAVGSAFSTIIPNPAYDPEWHIQDDEPLQPTFAEPYQNPANSFALNRSTGHGQSELWPHGRFHSITTEAPTNPLDLGKRQQSLFAEGGSTESEKTKTPPVPERPFHSFTTSQKWLVISTIGVAGLFSGLSSNIYFPSLDAIATVRPRVYSRGGSNLVLMRNRTSTLASARFR